jgi:hypothetical protein
MTSPKESRPSWRNGRRRSKEPELEPHPIRLVVTDDLRRSRLTVFFRLILVIPHYVWLYLWGIAACFAWIAAWFAALFTGRVPDGLHGFLASYLRYQTYVCAYLYLLADPFPPFSSSAGYPVSLEVDPPERQSRWVTFFRGILAIPALLIGTVLSYLLGLLAFLAWFACLFTGRMPEGFENLGAYCLRYYEQMYAYLYLLTSRYPSLSSPTLI